MSYGPANQKVAGQFKVNEIGGALFEFSRIESEEFNPWGCEFKIWVDEGRSSRFVQKLGKTVAYVIVDEAADGSPVVEKWSIKNFVMYPTNS